MEVYDLDAKNGSLGLKASYDLHGVVESLSVVRQNKLHKEDGESLGQRAEEQKPTVADLLLLTFGTGRASLVGYSSQLGPHVLHTYALYNFETDALGSNLRAESPGQRRIYGYGAKAISVTDPLGRCAAMLVNGNNIAVLPLGRLWGEVVETDMNGLGREASEGERENKLEDEEDLRVKLSRAVRRVALDTEDVWEMPPGCYLIDLLRLGIPSTSVLHMDFLHNQNGLPVLAILHSGMVRSSTGRLVVSRWNTHLTAITVSKHDVTVVWKVEKLPHDSMAVIPNDRGDAVVVSQNAIHHIVGGRVCRNLEVNGFARLTADLDYLTDSKSPLEMPLDGARWVWLDSDRLLVSLRYGQLAVFDIGPEYLNVQLTFQTSQATCLCVLDHNYLFLGSRLADSILLKYSLLIDEPMDTSLKGVVKLERVEDITTVEDEERFLYSSSGVSHPENGTQTGKSSFSRASSYVWGHARRERWGKFKSVNFEVKDALLCTGPIGGLCVGENAPDKLEERRAMETAKELFKQGKHTKAANTLKFAKEREKAKRKSKDIVVGAGRGRDGGVRVFCPALRIDSANDMLYDQQLENHSQSLWTVTRGEESLAFCTLWNSSQFCIYRAIGNSEKLVLDEETEKSSLESTKSPTVLIHGTDKFLIQICLDQIVVMEPDAPFTIVSQTKAATRTAFACQNYIFCVSRSRQPVLYHIDASGTPKIIDNCFHPDCAVAPVATGAIFRDPIRDSVFCGLVRGGLAENGAGALEVYDVEKRELVFRSNYAFAMGQRVLNHRRPTEALESNQGILAKLKVVRLCIAPVGRVEKDPSARCNAHYIPPCLCCTVALGNGDLVLYQVDGDWERLYRLNTDVITRLDRTVMRKPQAGENNEEETGRGGDDEPQSNGKRLSRHRSSGQGGNDGKRRREGQSASREEPTPGISVGDQERARKANRAIVRSRPQLVPFKNLGGFAGILFGSGLGTSACIIGTRGGVSVVRVDSEAYHVWSMSVSRECLFILASTRAASGNEGSPEDAPCQLMVLRGLKYMKHLRLDGGGSLPVVSVPLEASCTKMVFDSNSRSYLLTCSEDNAQEEKAMVIRSICSIKLLCADTLEVKHQYSLMRHEKAIVITNVTLDLAAQFTATRKLTEFIAVGTGFVGPEGEDAGCKGRVLVFQVETSTGTNEKKITLKHKIESKHIRGPVTAVSSVDGMLLATFGSSPSSLRIMYYDPTSDAFVARSFYDTPFCTLNLKVIKNYLLMGDIYRSVQVVHWHGFKREFRMLAKDPHPLQVYACDYVQHERSLGIVVSDHDSNLHILHLDNKKNTLQNRGEIHISSCINEIVRLGLAADKSINLYGTLDGSLGCLVPVAEQVFRRLFALQAAMSSSPLVPRNAGLNPRAYRTTEFTVPIQRQRMRNIADGALIWTYISLDYVSQRQLARLIGTTPETLVQDLLEIDTNIFSRAL
eukprot:CAMPEP_0203754058 /NCGR_PEP_ID=MMETSP0098-20131031/7718_1 /ASSEMBLY_ACC=CAM_ASM_000208 /TAXON_ID=96639 /ORGANISM=" , Strain NY0313808BC1" /LENGTH=1445 /DNA_ID=CAMNT_0050644909 /DNA_START=536 /DNA_END=4876 /DNA_ORIENTATION=-